MSKPATPEPPPSEVTPEPLYLRRREFLKSAGLGVLTAAATGAGLVALTEGGPGLARAAGGKGSPAPEPPPLKVLGRYSTDEPPTKYEDITHYNHFTSSGPTRPIPRRTLER